MAWLQTWQSVYAPRVFHFGTQDEGAMASLGRALLSMDDGSTREMGRNM